MYAQACERATHRALIASSSTETKTEGPGGGGGVVRDTGTGMGNGWNIDSTVGVEAGDWGGGTGEGCIGVGCKGGINIRIFLRQRVKRRID